MISTNAGTRKVGEDTSSFRRSMTRLAKDVAGRKVVRALTLHATLLLLAVVLLMPFLWFVSAAFRPRQELYQLFPSNLTVENFAAMMSRVPQMTSYYTDSVVITMSTVAAVVVIASMAGYALAWLRFPGRQVIFFLVVATMFIPPLMAVASLYVQLFDFGLLDTRTGLIFVYTGWHLGVATFIMRTVFSQIPRELEEAASVDGASRWRILWSIMLPLSSSGAVVAALITFVLVWGEYVLAFTLVGDTVRPMSVGIRLFQPHASDPDFAFNIAAAAGLVMFIPSVVIYVFMQRWFTKGLLQGAVKG